MGGDGGRWGGGKAVGHGSAWPGCNEKQVLSTCLNVAAKPRGINDFLLPCRRPPQSAPTSPPIRPRLRVNLLGRFRLLGDPNRR